MWGTMVTIIGVIILTFISALFSINRVGSLRDRIEDSQTVSFDTRYASLGESVVRSYFAGEAPPINLMNSADWTTGDSTGQSGGMLNGGAGVTVENLSLIEAFSSLQALPDSVKGEDEASYFTDPLLEQLIYSGSIEGKPYRFGVSLVIPDKNDFSKLPFLVSVPTILPGEVLVDSTLDASQPSTGADSRFTEQRLTPEMTSLLGTWASAYAQDDRATLQRLTGDPRANAQYHGLGGFSLVGTPTVLWSYQVAPLDSDGEVNTVLRMSFDVETPLAGGSSRLDDAVVGGGSPEEFRPKIIMDVLLGNHIGAQPTVIDWAPGGMWTILSEYRNAVLVGTGDSEDQTTSTKATPTTTTGGRAPGAPSLTMPTTSRTSPTTSASTPPPAPPAPAP